MKILVTDFDNTFFTKDYSENIKLVNEFVSEGNIFIIATGRPLYLLLNDLNKSVVCNYLICNDGAVIYDNNYKKIYESNLDLNDSKNIYDELKKDTNVSEVYIDTSLSFSTSTKDIANGIVALPIDREKANISINNIKSKYPNVQGYLSHRWINILDKNSSKGNAIKLLAKMNKWDIEKIITVGDNMNDLSMIQEFDSHAIKGNEVLMSQSKHVVNDFKELMEMIK